MVEKYSKSSYSLILHHLFLFPLFLIIELDTLSLKGLYIDWSESSSISNKLYRVLSCCELKLEINKHPYLEIWNLSPCTKALQPCLGGTFDYLNTLPFLCSKWKAIITMLKMHIQHLGPLTL